MTDVDDFKIYFDRDYKRTGPGAMDVNNNIGGGEWRINVI